MSRTETVATKVTEEEKAELTRLANISGVTISTYAWVVLQVAIKEEVVIDVIAVPNAE